MVFSRPNTFCVIPSKTNADTTTPTITANAKLCKMIVTSVDKHDKISDLGILLKFLN
jgi:hypothetical protein